MLSFLFTAYQQNNHLSNYSPSILSSQPHLTQEGTEEASDFSFPENLYPEMWPCNVN